MAIGHIAKGAFHRWLGKKPGAAITQSDIERGLKAGGHAAKMANFARNAKHFNHHRKSSGSLRERGQKALYGK